MRHKDSNWDCGPAVPSTERAILATLMDLRDELKEIRRELAGIRSTLNCTNVLRAARAVIRAERRLAAYQPLKRRPKC